MASSEEADGRLLEIVEAIEALARFDFDTTAPIGVNGDLFDALAAGVNMLGEELSSFRREVDERAAALSVANDELARRALYDSLTGLPNRSLFRERLGQAMAALAADGTGVTLLAIDLDGLKEVNDTLGHAAGDRTLIEVASRLRTSMRSGGSAARTGGDEFFVLFEDMDIAATETLARDLATRLRQPFDIDGQPVRTSASIGIAHGVPGQHPEELMRNADVALYELKSVGLGMSLTYVPAMHDPIALRLKLSSALRGAVERDEITVAYQPIVDLSTGAIVGFEALARWHDIALGDVPPNVFIPLAEQIGLMGPMGESVLANACAEAAAWHRLLGGTGPLPYVSVNLSAIQMRDTDLPSRVADILATTRLPAGSLMLEVTETLLVERIVDAVGVLDGLKRLGLRIALDDFGIGYSSLNYLRLLPVDVVKIDRTFVAGIATNWEEWSFAQAIVRLIQRLGLGTVMEGVEGAAQVAHARAIGCEMAQGYYFGHPVDAAATRALLSSGLAPASGDGASPSGRGLGSTSRLVGATPRG